MRPTAYLIAALLLAACSATDIDDIDFVGTMNVTPLQAGVGDTIRVIFEAEGPRLLSFFVDYGDDRDQFLSVAGSQTARWTARTTYAAPGVYEINGRVDELNDTLRFTSTVTIVEAATAVPDVFEAR